MAAAAASSSGASSSSADAAAADSPRSRFYRARKGAAAAAAPAVEDGDDYGDLDVKATPVAAAVGGKRYFNDGLNAAAAAAAAPSKRQQVERVPPPEPETATADDAEADAVAAAWAAAEDAKAPPPAPAAPPPRPRVKLNPKQLLMVSHFANRHNALMGGEAGSGKSEVYRDISFVAAEKGIDLQFVSSTVLSSLAIGGRTIYAFFGIDIHSRPRESYVADTERRRAAFLKANEQKALVSSTWFKTAGTDQISRIVRIDTLNIDEIGRLPTSIFKTVVAVLKAACFGIRTLPTTLGAGDFMQGSPAPRRTTKYSKEWEFDLAEEDREYIKDTDEWKELDFQEVTLTQVYRQQDPKQKRLLSEMRFSYLSESSYALLQTMLMSEKQLDTKLEADAKAAKAGYVPPVYLTCLLRDAALWNKRWLDALTAPERTLTPHIYVLLRTSTGYVASALYDQFGPHEYCVAGHTKPRGPEEEIHALAPEEIELIRSVFRSAADQCRIPIDTGGATRYEADKNEAEHAILGKLKVGAPLVVCQSQDRPSPMLPVANGTRGRIIKFAPGAGYTPQQPPARRTPGAQTWLFTKFQPIHPKDYTSHFPVTILREDGLGESLIGCVDRFFPLSPEDDSRDWTQRRVQICVRGLPGHLNFADTPLRCVGMQFEGDGVIDIGSAETFPNGGGYLYTMFSRFKDLKTVKAIKWKDASVRSDLNAWEDCRQRDPIASQFTKEHIEAYFRVEVPDDGFIQSTVGFKKRIPDKLIDELAAAVASATADKST